MPIAAIICFALTLALGGMGIF